ncbi:hypothetical protein BDZ94DRAFT_1212162 [Collybia nuda]|uniref:ubiquitinyl hydrolase 1 n=1 Tax=Collybia nuda TaxID=64659 RepID=A0A9P6CNI9_9AGAR|nr:hypothetical protein BDZ94DRAFT_1212162 [Collybia nuda]
MDLQPQLSSVSQDASQAQDERNEAKDPLDLVGGPFAVIESDPGVFTSLTRKLGVRNIELVELYDIEPWAVDHLNPHGLIFCFLWRKDNHRPTEFEDPAAERVWFANQLSDDACASHAILNVVLNCPEIDIGVNLQMFKEDTQNMTPVMRGLAVTNSPLLRQAHNSLARPADQRGALNALATTTLDIAKSKLKAKAPVKTKTTPKRGTKPPPAKRAKTVVTKDEQEDEPEGDEAYHFVGYVPAYGKVWELDGLKSGPLEVGELSPPNSDWMNIARPALRMKMEKYGGSAEGGSNIRFSLLAIVDGVYEKASDELELLKRERIALENRLEVGWEIKVDPALMVSARDLNNASPSSTGTTYAKDFGARKQDMNIKILDMPERNLIPAWEACIRNTLRAKVAVEDEVEKGMKSNADHVKRTFDYEPFFTSLIERLHSEGLLSALLDLDENGRKIKGGSNDMNKPKAPANGKGKH